MSLLGVVLAGGAARRFGSDKAIVQWHGKTLIEHSAEALRPFVDRIVVAGRKGDPAGLESIADRPCAGLGPLGGLCGALYLSAKDKHRGVLSIACDMPVVPMGIVGDLAAACGAAYVDQAPVLGFWPVELADRLAAFLARSEDRSIIGWGRSIGAMSLHGERDIPNINRPDDLDKLSR